MVLGMEEQVGSRGRRSDREEGRVRKEAGGTHVGVHE